MSIKARAYATAANMHRAVLPTYSIDQTAKAVGCSRAHIYNEVRAGRLKARKSGHRTLVLATDLHNYLDSLPALPVRAA